MSCPSLANADMTARESSPRDVCGSAEPVALAAGAFEVLVLVLARSAVLVETIEVLKRETVADADLVARADVLVTRAEVSEAMAVSVSWLVEVVDVDTTEVLVLVRPPRPVEVASLEAD